MGLRDVLDRLIRRPVADTPELLEANERLVEMKSRSDTIIDRRIREQAQRAQHRAGGR